MKQQYDENKYSLNLVKYQEQIKEAKDLSKKLEELDKVKTTTTVLNLKSDKTSIQKDTVSIRRNEEWVKALKKDAYISEATNVILDWMKLEKNNPSSSQVIKSID